MAHSDERTSSQTERVKRKANMKRDICEWIRYAFLSPITYHPFRGRWTRNCAFLCIFSKSLSTLGKSVIQLERMHYFIHSNEQRSWQLQLQCQTYQQQPFQMHYACMSLSHIETNAILIFLVIWIFHNARNHKWTGKWRRESIHTRMQHKFHNVQPIILLTRDATAAAGH